MWRPCLAQWAVSSWRSFAAGNLGVSPGCASRSAAYLEFCRTVPDLVFALIFVLAFGLGPMAGILAIAVHTAGRTWQAVLRSSGEHRPEAGRRPDRKRRLLDQDHALCGLAPGPLQSSQLCPAAFRNQCARRIRHGLRRRGRHRPGSDRGHPQVLLSRCIGHSRADHPHGHDHRPPDRTCPPSLHSTGDTECAIPCQISTDSALRAEIFRGIPRVIRAGLYACRGDVGAPCLRALAPWLFLHEVRRRALPISAHSSC